MFNTTLLAENVKKFKRKLPCPPPTLPAAGKFGRKLATAANFAIICGKCQKHRERFRGDATRERTGRMEPKFTFQVQEDRRGITFEGIEAGQADPEGALNLQVRVARDHLVLGVWPVKGEAAQISEEMAQILGPPRSAPSVCGFGDCQDDDKDAPQQTTMWEFDPATREEVLAKVKSFLGIS